jgi:hypothetical protein
VIYDESSDLGDTTLSGSKPESDATAPQDFVQMTATPAADGIP